MKKKSKKLVIIGAPDFEERELRKVLKEVGIFTATATFNGEPCTSSNAGQANGFRMDSGQYYQALEVILFECGKGVLEGLVNNIVLVCDHHEPGDVGFDCPPEEFWRGSSIGQLCDYLHIEPTEELRYVAALDHCPGPAYQGFCPGIDVEKLKNFSIKRKVEFFKTIPLQHPDKTSIEGIEEVIKKAKAVLLSLPRYAGFYDGRHLESPIDEGREAAFQMGVPYLESMNISSGIKKVTCKGFVSQEQVETFMCWAKSQPGVRDVYGNPIRGFAGAIFSN